MRSRIAVVLALACALSATFVVSTVGPAAAVPPTPAPGHQSFADLVVRWDELLRCVAERRQHHRDARHHCRRCARPAGHCHRWRLWRIQSGGGLRRQQLPRRLGGPTQRRLQGHHGQPVRLRPGSCWIQVASTIVGGSSTQDFPALAWTGSHFLVAWVQGVHPSPGERPWRPG